MSRDTELPRWARDWTREQIIEVLFQEHRSSDVALFQKFLEVGFKELEGGNVIFTDGSFESERCNKKNEKHKAGKICREFGWLSIDFFYLPRALFEEAVKLATEGEQSS